MKIELDDLTRPELHALLKEHLQSMYALSPPESVHALDLDKLRRPEISFWSAWEGSLLVGCGALKELDPKHGEIKSMRTPDALRRRGVGRAILAHIIEVARSRAYERVSLETGSQPGFNPAQQLYLSFGFVRCGPFGDYVEDRNSVFMSLRLRPEEPHSPSDDDRNFCSAFEACAVPPAQFNHEAHVRLAYVYLAEHDVDSATRKMFGALLNFLQHHGVPASKFHETLTRAWVLAIRHFMDRSTSTSAGDFVAKNQVLLDSNIMLTHYSASVLFSSDARASFIAPDLDPIPQARSEFPST